MLNVTKLFRKFLAEAAFWLTRFCTDDKNYTSSKNTVLADAQNGSLTDAVRELNRHSAVKHEVNDLAVTQMGGPCESALRVVDFY